MLTPVTSLGIRSGVNCTRDTVQATDLARALAKFVLPVPGTSSISRCPSASMPMTAIRTTSGLPSSTWETVAMMRPPVIATASVPADFVVERSSVLSQPGRSEPLGTGLAAEPFASTPEIGLTIGIGADGTPDTAEATATAGSAAA